MFSITIDRGGNGITAANTGRGGLLKVFFKKSLEKLSIVPMLLASSSSSKMELNWCTLFLCLCLCLLLLLMLPLLLFASSLSRMCGRENKSVTLFFPWIETPFFIGFEDALLDFCLVL